MGAVLKLEMPPRLTREELDRKLAEYVLRNEEETAQGLPSARRALARILDQQEVNKKDIVDTITAHEKKDDDRHNDLLVRVTAVERFIVMKASPVPRSYDLTVSGTGSVKLHEVEAELEKLQNARIEAEAEARGAQKALADKEKSNKRFREVVVFYLALAGVVGGFATWALAHFAFHI